MVDTNELESDPVSCQLHSLHFSQYQCLHCPHYPSRLNLFIERSIMENGWVGLEKNMRMSLLVKS